MIELFLTDDGYSSSTILYPNSGPGPTKLKAGNEDIGYFGEVADSDFITLAQWRDHLNPSMSIAIPTAPTIWFKFMYKGRVIFIPKIVASAARWQFIYQAGGVYGTDDNGLYPSGTPVNQYKPMTFSRGDSTWVMVPRLIRTATTDPATATTTGSDNEYDDLLMAMRSKFGSYSIQDLNITAVEISLNSVTGNTANCIARTNTGVSSRLKTQSSNARPVFEVLGDPLDPV